MNTVLISACAVTAVGFVCAVVLAVASKLMAVAVDERMVSIREHLPGVNCGACGFSGCDGYASAIVNEGAEAFLCTPGGDAAAKQISLILGKTPSGGVVKLRAVVHCVGDFSTNRAIMDYEGIRTCVAVRQLHGGLGACTFGCVGFGDCAAACPCGAICVENGLARVDVRKCGGCGLCAKICPNGLISIEYSSIVVAAKCRNTEKGAQMKDKCLKGCIGCSICVKACPSGAIAVSDFLAGIDYEKCTGCGMCAGACPRGCLLLFGK